MKRALSLAVGLLLAGGVSTPAFAQAEPQVIISHEMSTEDLNMAELQAFDQVATANRGMARRLAANPHLAKSKSFVKKYPGLSDFFAKYPGSKERFLADPGNYLSGVHMYHGRLVRAVHKKKSAAKTEAKSAAPVEVAPPAPEAPAAPAAPPSTP